MLRALTRNYNYISLCGVAFVEKTAGISPEIPNEKLVGWPAVKRIFILDEFGEITPQLNNIFHCTFMTGLFGAGYGGFLRSKDAYHNFIESNQATKFADHFEAKKKLQSTVSLAFAKGALQWSIRIAFFGCLYITFVTVLNAYKGHASIFDYTISGLVSGGIYRLNLGLKGFIGGGILGAFMGTFAGTLTILMNKFFGFTLDDVEKWNYEVASVRKMHTEEALKRHKMTEEGSHQLLESHDESVKGKQIL